MGWKIMPAGRVRKAARTKDAKAILDRLRTYLDEKSWEPIRILHGFWQNQQKAITYQELRELVRQGYLDEVTARLWQQDYSMLVKTQMPKIWGSAMIAGSVSQPVMESILPAFELNMQTPGVVRWIRSRGAALVTVSTQTQKDAISLLLEEKIRQKYTVDELARLIRPTIGLYRQQTAAVERYYDKMVQSLTKDHPRTKPQVIRQRALTQATKYAERLHRQRAITIAQTEMAFAYNFGADEGIRQAQADFLIGRVEKRWCTSGDDRVCPECSALDGRQIGMDELFFSGNRVEYDESGLYPPLHPRCACAVQYVEVEAPKFREIVENLEHNIKLSVGSSDDADVVEVERIGNIDPSMTDEALKVFGNQIRNRDVENAVIIDVDGNVFQAIGNSQGVKFTGVNLVGASITHNHPEINGILSFGRDDFEFLQKHRELRVLEAVNSKYNYRIIVLRDLSKLSYNMLRDEAHEYVTLEDILNLEEYDSQHLVMEYLDRKGYVKYVRTAHKDIY